MPAVPPKDQPRNSYVSYHEEAPLNSSFSQLGTASAAPEHAPNPAEQQQQVAHESSELRIGEKTMSVSNLSFAYPDIDGRPRDDLPHVIRNMNLSLCAGDRCLLVGPNGAGKTTLLRILAGKHMVDKDSVQVLGRPVFHDTSLTASGVLSYIGGNWQKDVAFAGYGVPLSGDFPASRMLNSVTGVSEERKNRIINILDVDPEWRMHKVSDGQRRRVQLAVGLLKEFKVLLLDEITVDLDILVRANLMRFLKEETEQRGATVVYVTHIFDGLEDWATHLTYVAHGQLQFKEPVQSFPDLNRLGGLLDLISGWLRNEKEERERRERELGYPTEQRKRTAMNNGWAAGRALSGTSKSDVEAASERGVSNSANTVVRM